MDANGTRFHLVLGQEDWAGAVGDFEAAHLEWDGDTHTLALAAAPPVLPPRTGDWPVSLDDRRGAGRDQYGHWYWIGEDPTEIFVRHHGSDEVERYWPPPPGVEECDDDPGADFTEAPEAVTPTPLLGLAVTTRQYLVVGAPELPGLLLFDLHGGGPPRTLRWPTAPGDFRPLDMAPDPDGGVWIIDVPADSLDPSARAPRLWKLNRRLAVEPLSPPIPTAAPAPDFRPASGPEEPAPAPTSDDIVMTAAADLDAADPVSVEAVGDGTVLVLDVEGGGPSVVRRYRGGSLVAVHGPLHSTPGPLHDLAYVPSGDPATLTGRLLVVDGQGDQAFEHRFEDGVLDVEPEPAFLPVRLFSGKALVAVGGQVYYDLDDQWLPIVDWRRPAYARQAVVTFPLLRLDSREPGCVWHRLLLDACIPPGTSVGVESRAADEPDELAAAPWEAEPRLYRRPHGSEQAFHRFGDPGDERRGTWELLFQRAHGRYLQLRLTIGGDGRRTPRLWALRAHYPRFSYLRSYLPAVYQEDAESAWFLDRYLANPEGTLTTVEDRIAAFQALLDLDTVDGEYLDWLATWFGAVLEPDWDDDRRRLFLRHAVALFARRGTVRGLLEAIRVAIDPCPDDSIFSGPDTRPFATRIVEHYRTRGRAAVTVGDPTAAADFSLVVDASRWSPEHGSQALHARWAEFTGASSAFPPLTPPGGDAAGEWRRFLRRQVAVPYADVGQGDAETYRAFLADRYTRPEKLNTAWGRLGANRYTSFSDVALPATLPSDGVPLADWVQFVSVYLPAVRAAHGFTVLVPIRPDEPDDVRAQRLGRVHKIVMAERPAHTTFRLRPYWAALRVGEARVGLETLIGEGARFVAMTLGRGRLAQSYLPGAHPWEVTDRFVIGRESVHG